MISVPIAVDIAFFEWQLALFWHAHRLVYGDAAATRAHALIIRRNQPDAPRSEAPSWSLDMPYSLCESFFDLGLMPYARVAAPLNMQAGLAQWLPQVHDDTLLEVLDCDMFHLRAAPTFDVGDDELSVCTLYEDWHLHSLTAHRDVIAPYFEHGGAGYNGGFVPIIGRARTFKRILPEWIAVHVDLLRRPFDDALLWWAGMFALQAACEKAAVRMTGRDSCYIPGAGPRSAAQHAAHYSVDPAFDKRRFPDIERDRLDATDPYGATILHWLDRRAPR